MNTLQEGQLEERTPLFSRNNLVSKSLIPAMSTGTISTHESGADFVVEWQIPRFSTLQKTDGASYMSPFFSFGSVTWHLRIWPNGASLYGTSGHVDLRLVKDSSGRSIRVSVSLSLKTAEGKRHKEEHSTKDFGKFYPENCHDLLRFISRPELTRLRSELVPDDVLTVVCTMKGSSSAGSDRNDPERANVGESSQCVRPSTQSVRPSTQSVRPSTQSVRPSTQTVEASTQTVEEKLEPSASGSSIWPYDAELNHDFKQLFLSKEDYDVTVKVGNLEFPAHKAILKARSPVFASTFRHDMKENVTGIVEIEDCDPSTFSDFLCYLYCGDATLISQENVFSLFTAADKYQVSNFRAKCLEFMKKNPSVDTFCETLTLALRHSEAELIRLCTDYFKQNVPRIIVTVKWQTFLAQNPTEGNELFIKSFVPNSS